MSVTWQEVRDHALEQIQSRHWRPGAQIPKEETLAQSLGCSRTTVNRALRALAEDGWLERRRKAGSRVAVAPERRARLAIPVIRNEIETSGDTFSHEILARRISRPSQAAANALKVDPGARGMRIRTLYLASGRPYAVEDRWVHLRAAPEIEHAALEKISPNEWLVSNARFSFGVLSYSAEAASPETAMLLACKSGEALMVLERHTFGPELPVTFVRLHYATGYNLKLEI